MGYVFGCFWQQEHYLNRRDVHPVECSQRLLRQKRNSTGQGGGRRAWHHPGTRQTAREKSHPLFAASGYQQPVKGSIKLNSINQRDRSSSVITNGFRYEFNQRCSLLLFKRCGKLKLSRFYPIEIICGFGDTRREFGIWR